MLKFTDTHTHLYLNDYEGENNAVVQRSIDAGVNRMIFPGVAPDTLAPMLALAAQYPQNVYVATGLHPTEVAADYQQHIDTMLQPIYNKEYAAGANIMAVGEIGIDKHWDTSFLPQQMLALELQAKAAAEANLPVIIHCREALDETLEVLSGVNGFRGVFHSFGGSQEDVERIRKTLGDEIYFGINGIVTFKNSNLREILPHIGIEQILLETDAPWLAPVPMRGRRNESSYVPHIAAHIAQSMNIPIETVSEVTNNNATELFSLPTF